MPSSILASSPTSDHLFAEFSSSCSFALSGISNTGIRNGRKNKVFYKPVTKHFNDFVFFSREQGNVSSSKKIRYVT